MAKGIKAQTVDVRLYPDEALSLYDVLNGLMILKKEGCTIDSDSNACLYSVYSVCSKLRIALLFYIKRCLTSLGGVLDGEPVLIPLGVTTKTM